MARDRVTINDVARAANVSAMSVSRVLNGRPGVGKQTRKRIEEAVEELGFRPSALAVGFRQGRLLGSVGMIIPRADPPLFSSLAAEIDERIASAGLTTVMASSGRNAERERSLARGFLAMGFEGLLLFSEDDDHAYLQPELDRGKSIVFLGSPPRNVRAPSVLVDNRAGAVDALGLLARRGHRRIAVVGSEATYQASERVAGAREAMGDLAPAEVQVVTTEITTEGGYRAGRSLLDAPGAPTGILCTNYLLTVGTLRAIRDSGRHVEVVSFDDFDTADLLTPPVSAISQDPHAIAEQASQLLLQGLDAGDRDAQVTTVTIHPRLLARGA
ncbi:LacI family DNA-binding transcriptional regulator [Isoptericola sp. BMS4]|uniref:LacI family DNA-binding transcriptional regulator n=1 Tax=Isoptericola sp. BMS4 TaxID=2527875 RepID=UPI002105A602|nr:LacI family DNA-binding transcriptional regulator [Isoptericola sp. BMS4]